MANFTSFCKSLLIPAIAMTSSLHATLKFSSKDSTIKLKDSTSQLRLETQITGFNGTLKIEGKTDNSIQALTPFDTIIFAEGVVASDANSFTLTGTYNPITSDTIQLGNNDYLEVAAGNVLQAVSVNGTVGAASVIKGQPTFASAIVINSSSNFLQLGIQNKLTQNITMNGGTLTLIDDLGLQDGVLFMGNGTVDLGNFTLSMDNNTSSAWSGNLTLKNVGDISLYGYTQLTGEWIFNDVGGTSSLNGNGNVLNMSGGGNISVAQNHTLYLSDIIIRGLGSGQGSFSINNTGGTIKMSNVTLELTGDYSHTAGCIYIQGDNCRVISGNTSGGNYQFNVSGTGTLLTVDHSVLEYETLGGQNVSPFIFTSVGLQKQLINGGVIRSATLDITVNNVVFDETAVSAQLQGNYDITSATNIVFTNSGGGTNSLTVDGQGYFLQFPYAATGMFQIANNLTVTLDNTILKDFNTNIVSYGTNSALQFGDGTVLELGANTSIGASSKPLTFVGNATLDGYGHTITLTDSSNRITITGPKILTIRNATLLINQVSALACLSYDAKILFQDVDICVQAPGYTFALGSIDIVGYVKLSGCDQNTPGGVPIFTYSTTGTLTVQTASTLKIDGDINFTYQASPPPSTTANTTSYSQSKRRLKLADPSATLHLNSCTLTSTSTALAFDYGNFIVEDNVTFNINSASGSEVELGTSLDVLIKAGAILQVGGPLRYTSTTYP
jgi:hypothetical protein